MKEQTRDAFYNVYARTIEPGKDIPLRKIKLLFHDETWVTEKLSFQQSKNSDCSTLCTISRVAAALQVH